MPKPTYWLDLFTGTTWQEFLEAGAKVSGFRECRWKTVQTIKPGETCDGEARTEQRGPVARWLAFARRGCSPRALVTRSQP